MSRRRSFLALGVIVLGACERAPEAASTPNPATPRVSEELSSPAAPRPALRGDSPPRPAVQPPATLWNEFSGHRAMAEVEKQIAFGPRPSGSAELAQARLAIVATLQSYGWVVEQQQFSDDTPRGPIRFVNLIARHPGIDGKPPSAATPRAIVCSHYDTKRFSTIRFVGASDGASSTGALLEMARVLALDPVTAAKVELVFFDGEEAVQQFTEKDGLYGSRHYAATLAESGRARQFKLAILWDMIGDKELTITLPPDSPPELARGIFESAEALHMRQYFSFFSRDILDDHVPLRQRGIPAIDLIDFDYMPWHTADDTLDKLSPDSLHKVGAVTLHYLKRALGP